MPLKHLRKHRDVFTQSSASTASQRARELQSFGPDLDYKPSGKGVTKATPRARALSKMITHAQKEGQQPDMEAVMEFLNSIGEAVSYDADDEDEDVSEDESGNASGDDGGDEEDGYDGEDEYESKGEIDDEGNDDDDDDDPVNY